MVSCRSGLEFKVIDLDKDKDKDIAIKFLADSFLISFGTDKGFWELYGRDGQGYIDELKKRDPKKSGSFHIWKKDKIIGQTNLSLFRDDVTWGYVNLYYLKKEFRGKGHSKFIDIFAVNILKGLGVHKAKLSVSPTNTRAMKFYEKNGWVDKGLRIFDNSKAQTAFGPLHYMEKIFLN